MKRWSKTRSGTSRRTVHDCVPAREATHLSPRDISFGVRPGTPLDSRCTAGRAIFAGNSWKVSITCETSASIRIIVGVNASSWSNPVRVFPLLDTPHIVTRARRTSVDHGMSLISESFSLAATHALQCPSGWRADTALRWRYRPGWRTPGLRTRNEHSAFCQSCIHREAHHLCLAACDSGLSRPS